MTDRHALDCAPTPAVRNADLPEAALQTPIALRDAIRNAATAGMDWIQIREKDFQGRALSELTRFAVEDTRGSGARILINDRLDVAVATGAHGVHLGGTSFPVDAVVQWRRSAHRTDFLIGVSCHSLENAREAERKGAGYAFFGPIFATPSKAAFGPPQGIERLREVCAAVSIPVLAIGGIDLQNASECIAAGAAGVAAIRMFQDARDLAAVVARLHALPAAYMA